VNLPGGWELVLVVLVIMVLFGAKRLPEASRSLGRSLRIFKAETKGLRDDDTPTTTGHDTRHVAGPLDPGQAPPATGTEPPRQP
jgi:sec-independent protein translocase protein TatA